MSKRDGEAKAQPGTHTHNTHTHTQSGDTFCRQVPAADLLDDALKTAGKDRGAVPARRSIIIGC